MQNGRIVRFESDSILTETRDRCIKLLSDGRHEIVARATDLAGALSILDQIASGEIQANTVIFDADLPPIVTHPDGRDTRKLTKKIGKLALPVRTIGLYGHSVSDLGVKVDAAIPRLCPVNTIVNIIDNLEDPAA